MTQLTLSADIFNILRNLHKSYDYVLAELGVILNLRIWATTVDARHWAIVFLFLKCSGVARCQKVGGGTQTRDLCTFDKEPI